MRRKLVLVSLLGAAAAVAASTTSGAESVTAGNLNVIVDGNVRPNKLPKKQRAPVGLFISSDIKTVDGNHPPAISSIQINFDRDGTLFSKGLPRCPPERLENTTTPQAKAACSKALIGRGFARASVKFPDQAPFEATSPLLAFNGTPQGGKPRAIIHAYAFVPAPTTFVVPGLISSSSGRYGKRIEMQIPPIAGGYGSITHFDVFIKRLFKVKDKKRSYLISRCSRGNLQAEGTYTFSDGTALSGTVVRGCSPRG